MNGMLHDVTFADGTCIDLFEGCDDPSDFQFSSEADALAAAGALLAQVFIDDSLGSFDSVPSLTLGCSNSADCEALTPYGIRSIRVPSDGVSVGVAENRDAGCTVLCDSTRAAGLFRATDTTAEDHLTWAIWVAASVPEPPAALLLALGPVLARVGYRAFAADPTRG